MPGSLAFSPLSATMLFTRQGGIAGVLERVEAPDDVDALEATALGTGDQCCEEPAPILPPRQLYPQQRKVSSGSESLQLCANIGTSRLSDHQR